MRMKNSKHINGQASNLSRNHDIMREKEKLKNITLDHHEKERASENKAIF
jgi:hypothetical protein